MQHLKILFPKGFPLRPLLLAAGAAVTTAGVYYLMKKKKSDDEEKTAEHAQTSKAPNPLTEAKRRYESSYEEYGARLRKEKSVLMTRINVLQGIVQELGNMLFESHTECAETSKKCDEQSRELSVLRSEYTELKDILLKKCDEPQINRVLLSQKVELKRLLCEKEELLKVTAAEAESKYELATEKCEQRMESNTQLEKEKSEPMSADVTVPQSEMLVLMEKVETLQNMVEGLTSLLSQTRQECAKAITEQAIMKGVHEFAMSEAKERQKALKRKRRSLAVALEDSERNNQDLLEKLEETARMNIDLEDEISQLAHNLEPVRERLVNAEEALASSRRRCEELIVECELKEQQVLERDSKLESLVTKILPDLEKESEAHSRLKAQYKELLKEREKEREAHRILKLEYDQMKKTLDNGSPMNPKQPNSE